MIDLVGNKNQTEGRTDESGTYLPTSEGSPRSAVDDRNIKSSDIGVYDQISMKISVWVKDWLKRCKFLPVFRTTKKLGSRTLKKLKKRWNKH